MEKKKEVKSDLPKEYKKGSVKFLGCKIDLSFRTFIPRLETGFWVEAAINELKSRPALAVLDLFSGSGCVGIAVLKKIKESSVDFCDIEPRALRQIKKNLKINKIDKKRYRVYCSDIFEKLPKEKLYDAILANPPYVDPDRVNEIQATVFDYEPHVALFSKKNGMAAIEKFLTQAKKHLGRSGVVYMEFDGAQAGLIGAILKKEKYSSWRIFRDQFERKRFVRIEI